MMRRRMRFGLIEATRGVSLLLGGLGVLLLTVLVPEAGRP